VRRFDSDGFRPTPESPECRRDRVRRTRDHRESDRAQHHAPADAGAVDLQQGLVGNLLRHSEVVQRLVFSTRLAQMAAQLLGVDGVRLYHDQALYKEPGGGIAPWHADQYYWPLSSDRCCTVSIPLQPTPLDMGPLEFAVSSHAFEFGGDMEISDESDTRLQEALAAQGFEVSQEPYDLGDVSFHRGWTFHRAGLNHTQTPRRAMTVIYLDADLTAPPRTNDNQVRELPRWFPGVSPRQVPSPHSRPFCTAAGRRSDQAVTGTAIDRGSRDRAASEDKTGGDTKPREQGCRT
jgi:ectoine hydroxylase-related dioxygenase (phytanoyl-CoA dioxygenase family)